MSTTRRNYVIRLSAAGQRELERDLKSAGVAGERALKRIQTATKPAGAGLNATNRAANDLKGGLKGVSDQLPAMMRLSRFLGTTALIGGIVSFGKSSLDVGKQFQAAMKRVEAATQASEDDMKRLQNAAREMGATTAFTAMQAADAIEVLAKNGLDVETILGGALDATLAVAGALGGDLAKSADLATDLMAQFNLKASDLPDIADRVAGAALKSKFGFDDLRLAIGQAGGVAGQFGVDIDDFLTSLAATAPAFASGSDAGTSFKTFLQRLTPDSDKARDAMKSLGLEFFDAQGRMKSMEEIAGELQQGIAGLTEEARNEALKTIFGTDAIRTALLLANTGAKGFSDLASALKEVSAQDQAQVRLEGLDGALKELAAAWEAVQLTAAENGGLEIAEKAADRLTAALRYLSENFEEVEEVVERVAQALVVYLVGRGITYAVARAVAMRATYIELAGAVTGVGSSATRALGPLQKMGVAMKVLTGTMGGPFGLAITAASILALGLDLDKTSDAMDAADTATQNAITALDKYREATKQAKEEQKELGGAVSAATEKILEQSRADLQIALANARSKMGEAMDGLQGAGLMNVNKFNKADVNLTYNKRPNPEAFRISELIRSVRDGKSTISELSVSMQRLVNVGDEVEVAFAEIKKGTEGAGDAVVAYAKEIGGFEKEIANLKSARGSAETREAYRQLEIALSDAADAGERLRSGTLQTFYEWIKSAADTQKAVADIEADLSIVGDLLTDTPTDTILTNAADDAKTATDKINEAAKALERMNGVYKRYNEAGAGGFWQTDRGAYQREEAEVANSGILNLIGKVEGTDKGRGYNETLGYGAYTDGPVNLINMTLREVLALQRQMLAHPDNKYNSSAVGRYQIVSNTLGGINKDGSGGLIKQLGLSLDDMFTPDLQDRLATQLVRGRMGQGKEGFYNEWEGFKKSGTPWSTIQTALGAQAVPRVDTEVAARNADAAKESADARKRDSESLTKLVEAGDDRLAQLTLENQMAGQGAAEQARLLFLYERLTEAKRAGIDVQTQMTGDGRLLIDVINAQADAIAKRTAEQEIGTIRTQEEINAFEDSRNAVKSAFDNFRSGGEGFKGFFADIFSFMSDKLWDMAFDPVWDTLADSLSGILNPKTGGGGWFGTIIGGLFGKKKADGGEIEGLASGGSPRGRIRGSGGKRQDNIPIWASVGEFMQPASAVDYYGADFMEAVRQRRLPRPQDDLSFSAGGPMGGSGGGGPYTRPGQAQVHVTTETSPFFTQIVRVQAADVSSTLDQINTRNQNRSLQDRNMQLRMRGTT
ncbi:TP901 family phage tail tape measure protein [Sulfitobacter undariae]|uniref:TP901 family phage tail tape measure protein n=1 Tax=Sulfitobacter undariae TaxID=1563671 RepID=A0A7W6EB13_9RHOB|nr:phage tail tape measure protein [Sulfitobacter undariae]MBB3995310.1 TP901 family phage tail tape measure protein [Sulfitobacter undariae]